MTTESASTQSEQDIEKDERTEARTSSTTEHHASELLRLVFLGILDNDFGDLTMRQMAILLLVSVKRLPIGEIATLLSIPAASVSKSCDMLQRKKVVMRQREGKSVFVRITPRGKAVVGRAVSTITGQI